MMPPPRLFLVVTFITIFSTALGGNECRKKYFSSDSFVCVCDAEYCDFPGTIPPPETGRFTTIVTSRDEYRFQVSSGYLSSGANKDAIQVNINNGQQFQTMLGFGGAFTDSMALNVKTVSYDVQDALMRSYFAPEGIQYDLCRIPIAGSDFSTRPYSYDDVVGDVALEHFSLAPEDYNYKLPLIRKAIELSDRELKLFGTPWSPPAWMKENGMFNGSGGLLKEMWQPYSNYLVKFVEEYEAEGVPIWGLTTQNEPLTGFEDWFGWNTCGWTAEDQRDWIKTNLGPTLEAAGMRRLKLMIDDHNRDTIPWYPEPAMSDPASAAYLDGIALHWYSDEWQGPEVMDETHWKWPDKFILYSESCCGWSSVDGLGEWLRMELYASNIITDLEHWATGWLDWNMALDMTGGPNWAHNTVAAPIIVNMAENEFYKVPMFYGIGHFSKFILPGARRVESSTSDSSLWATAVVNPDGSNAIILLHWNEWSITASVSTEDGRYANFQVPPKSITTVLI